MSEWLDGMEHKHDLPCHAIGCLQFHTRTTTGAMTTASRRTHLVLVLKSTLVFLLLVITAEPQRTRSNAENICNCPLRSSADSASPRWKLQHGLIETALERSHLDVSIVHRITVVLQKDPPFRIFAKLRHIFELALRLVCHEFFSASLKLKHFDSV